MAAIDSVNLGHLQKLTLCLRLRVRNNAKISNIETILIGQKIQCVNCRRRTEFSVNQWPRPLLPINEKK